MTDTPDVIDLLAAARPASLAAPPSDPERRYRHLEKAFAQSVQRRARHRPGRRLVGVGLGLVATATATAVAVATIGGSPATERSTATPPTGRDLVLAAADQAALQPLGTYWESDRVMAQSFPVRARTGDYMIAANCSELLQTTAAKGSSGNLLDSRQLPARPLTMADTAAWRRAGSPSTFQVRFGTYSQTYTTARTKWMSRKTPSTPGGGFNFAGFNGASVAQLKRLPTDTASLTRRFMASLPSLSRTLKEDPTELLLNEVSMNLENTPIPPKLRAGMLRMLAAAPGLRRIDSVTDPLGRPGFAFASVDPDDSTGYTDRKVVIFGSDGTYLASEDILVIPGGPYRAAKPGLVISYSADRSSGWTNTRPKPPAALPHFPG